MDYTAFFFEGYTVAIDKEEPRVKLFLKSMKDAGFSVAFRKNKEKEHAHIWLVSLRGITDSSAMIPLIDAVLNAQTYFKLAYMTYCSDDVKAVGYVIASGCIFDSRTRQTLVSPSDRVIDIWESISDEFTVPSPAWKKVTGREMLNLHTSQTYDRYIQNVIRRNKVLGDEKKIIAQTLHGVYSECKLPLNGELVQEARLDWMLDTISFLNRGWKLERSKDGNTSLLFYYTPEYVKALEKLGIAPGDTKSFISADAMNLDLFQENMCIDLREVVANIAENLHSEYMHPEERSFDLQPFLVTSLALEAAMLCSELSDASELYEIAVCGATEEDFN